MTHAFIRWFAPPDLAPVTLRRHARALWLVSWPFFAVVTVGLGIAVMVDTATLARRATTVTAVGVLVAILHTISRRGRPILASWILVIGLSIIVTQRAWITGGIHAPVAVFYVLFIVMAGALLATRGAIVTAAVCTLGAIALTAGELLGVLTPRAGAGSALGGFVFVMLAIGIALVLHALVAYQSRRSVPDIGAVQMLVHDMRSPIQITMANLELLREETKGEGTSRLDDALASTTRLQQLTTSVLDVSRLEAGTMPVRRVLTDLSTLAHTVVASLRILQPAREITVSFSDAVMCNCDPDLMRRVLENLVGNAMKHTAIGDQIRVAVSETPERVRITVADNGPGVPRDRRAGLLGPFDAERVASTTGRDSYGLGLAFCRLAVEAQGGTISFAAGDVAGTVVVVELVR